MKERSSNIELFRIAAMFFIIAHHYLVLSGLSEYIALYPTAKRSLFLILFGMWGKMGSNCFVLITGYFMCKSKINMTKFLKLLLEYEFYKIAEYGIFVFAGFEQFSLDTAIRVTLPITNLNSNFVDCYLIFYLFIPFLNIMIQNMTEKQHRNLLFLCVGVYSILAALSEEYINVTLNMVTWFMCLYIVAAYIRFYPRLGFKNVRLWWLLSFGAITITVIDVLYRQLHGRNYWWYLNDCNKPLAFLVAFCLFMAFLNLRIPQSKLINACGASCFGVLLIHSGTAVVQNWLWGGIARNVEYYFSSYMPFHAVFWVLVVFFVCVLIDKIRICFIEKPLFGFGKKYIIK